MSQITEQLSLQDPPHGRSGTVRLPNEILGRVFDSLSLTELVRASHVSSSWRSVATCHSTCCRHIQHIDHGESTEMTPARRFLVFRTIGNSSTSNVVNLCIMHARSNSFTTDVILPLVETCLPRCVSLNIVVHSDYAQALFHAVAHPAPFLEFARLDAHDRVLPSLLEIPPLIFAGHAPRLRRISLSTFLYPAAIVPAFAAVTSLIQEFAAYHPVSTFAPRNLFVACPKLEFLRLGDSDGGMPPDIWDSCRDFKTLVRLCVSSNSLDAILRALTSPTTRRISIAGISDSDDPQLGEVLVHLVGRISLEISHSIRPRHTPTSLRIRLSDSDGRVRKVRTDYLWPEFDRSLDIVARSVQDVLHRVDTLKVDAHLFVLIPDLLCDTAMPGLEVFIMTMNTDLLAADEAWDLRLHRTDFTKLNRVELRGFGDTEVPVGWLARFMGHTLGRTARRDIVLVLKGALLVGDSQLVWGFFSSITLLPE